MENQPLTLHPLTVFSLLLASASLANCMGQLSSTCIVNEEGIVPDLSCPGDAGCETATGRFRVGAAKRAITPTVEPWTDSNGNGQRDPGESFEDINGNGRWDPVWLAGFDRGRAATAVHDDTWARALSVTKGETRLGIVVLDLLGFSHDDVVSLRLAARDAGLDFDHIAVIATHTHQTKDSLGFGGDHLLSSGYDHVYNCWVIDQAVQALAEAQANEENAKLSVAETATPPGLIGDSRFPKIINQDLHALRFEGNHGTIATLVVWGNHPEALGGRNTIVSSDYPHYLRRDMEEAYPGSTAFFIPGTLGGLMNPMDIVGCPDAEGREKCPTGTFEKAEYVGSRAAQVAVAALNSPTASQMNPDLSFRVHAFILHVSTPEIIGAFQLGVVPRKLFRNDGTLVIFENEPSYPFLPYDDIIHGRIGIQSEVNSLTLGPATLLTMPGEVFPELWMKDESGNSLVERKPGADFPAAPILPPYQSVIPNGTLRIPVNQGNDAIGYIIPKTQWDRQAPYVYGNEQYGEGVSLGPSISEAIYKALVDLYSF